MSETNVTLIVAMLSAIVALYGYFYSKKKEREFALAKMRQEIYQKLVKNLYERVRLFQQDPNIATYKTLEEVYAYIMRNPELSKNMNEMLQNNTLLCIYGTDEAIKAASNFQLESAAFARDNSQKQPDLPGLILTLRRNIFSGFSDMKKTKVSKEDIARLMTA